MGAPLPLYGEIFIDVNMWSCYHAYAEWFDV